MRVIMRDAGDDFADEVAYWVAAGLRIVPQADPYQVVLEEPEPREHHANPGHWRGLLRKLPGRRRTVTIAMRRPIDADPTTALPPPPAAGYGAAWQ